MWENGERVIVHLWGPDMGFTFKQRTRGLHSSAAPGKVPSTRLCLGSSLSYMVV